jgi:hypothetical protein
MANCEHENLTLKKTSDVFFGETFDFKAEVCQDCGAYIWDDSVENQFNDWLRILYQKKRTKFQVQFFLSKNAKDILEEFSKSYPGLPNTTILKVFVAVYLDVVEPNESYKKKFDKVIKGEIFESFQKGKFEKLKIQLKPNAFREYTAMANLVGISLANVVEESVERMLALCVEKDQKLREFWIQNIKEEFNRYLKVA